MAQRLIIIDRELLIIGFTSLRTLVENLKIPHPLSFNSLITASISLASTFERKNDFGLRFLRYSPVPVLVRVYANGCPLILTLNSDRGGCKLKKKFG